MPPRNVKSKETHMRILTFLMFLVWTFTAHAEIEKIKVQKRGVADDIIKCEWKNTEGVPCITIKVPVNGNIVQQRISPTTIVDKQQIEKYNINDVKSALEFVNNVAVVQSGPTGQQTSVFMRGTNSNHTLVLLNGIAINDQSTPNGLFDFGQDFTTSLQRIEVYKGSAGAHWGADAIGGAVNLVTDINWQDKVVLGGANGEKSISGNIAKEIDGWQIGLTGGMSESKTQSALKGGTDKDGAENKSIALVVKKWITDKLQFRTNFFTRNTYADLDGHSLALQNGYDSDNTLYAMQTGVDYNTKNTKNYITVHSHSYDRDYISPGELDTYDSDSYTLRSEHKRIVSNKFSYGLGFEHKIDEATFSNEGSYSSNLDGDYNSTGLFGNISYIFRDDIYTTVHYRNDNNSITKSNDSYKIGIMKTDLLPELDVRLSHNTGFKNPSLYELYGTDNYGYKGNVNLDAEISETNEIGFDFRNWSVNIFETNIMDPITYSYPTYVNGTGTLKQSGWELAYAYSDEKNIFNWSGTSLSSKKVDGNDQLRRPELSTGFNYERMLEQGLSLIVNYKFTGEHFDVHNSNYSTITMPETHIMDVGITKYYQGMDIGLRISNLFDEDYQRPHGFSQDGIKLGLIIKSRF